ncbi:MAG: alpha/beta hydrolase [Oscillospiraceae bacterium]|nr:alpha/beta hydrolase [Candidatus Equicaccousia limihippi]
MANTYNVISNKCETEYIKFGNGQKNLVILPGIGVKSVISSADAVENAYSVFKNDYTVYLFDYKKNMSQNPDAKEFAEGFISAMDALKLKDTYLLGVSHGGMVAQIIAAKRKDLIKKAVFASSMPCPNEVSDDTFSTWERLAKKGDGYNLNVEFFGRVNSQNIFEQCLPLLGTPAYSATEIEFDRFAKLSHSCLIFDGREYHGEITCESLVIGSEQDKVLSPEGSTELAKALNCEIYMYDGYSHAVFDEAPDFKQRITEFFDK